MLMLSLSEEVGFEGPKPTTFQPGDVIHVVREDGFIKIKVMRGDAFLYIGNEYHACITAQLPAHITAPDAWMIIAILLRKHWVLANIFVFTDDEVCARVQRIATCPEEADPNLPSCEAGGDGFGRN